MQVCNMTHNGSGWRSAGNSDPSRPATEIDYLINVQVIEFADSVRFAGTIAEQRTKS